MTLGRTLVRVKHYLFAKKKGPFLGPKRAPLLFQKCMFDDFFSPERYLFHIYIEKLVSIFEEIIPWKDFGDLNRPLFVRLLFNFCVLIWEETVQLLGFLSCGKFYSEKYPNIIQNLQFLQIIFVLDKIQQVLVRRTLCA